VEKPRTLAVVREANRSLRLRLRLSLELVLLLRLWLLLLQSLLGVPRPDAPGSKTIRGGSAVVAIVAARSNNGRGL
jgi:hypothetical protein